MQIAFYATPIVWKAEQIRQGAQYMPLNPFFSLLEVVRVARCTATAPGRLVWASALAYSAGLTVVAWLLFVAGARTARLLGVRRRRAMDFAGVTVLCIGDVMLDRFMHGKIERISP